MNKYTIYHNPRCRKSREALQFLEQSGHEIEIIRYLDAPLSKNELQDVLNKLRLNPVKYSGRMKRNGKAFLTEIHCLKMKF